MRCSGVRAPDTTCDAILPAGLTAEGRAWRAIAHKACVGRLEDKSILRRKCCRHSTRTAKLVERSAFGLRGVQALHEARLAPGNIVGVQYSLGRGAIKLADSLAHSLQCSLFVGLGSNRTLRFADVGFDG